MAEFATTGTRDQTIPHYSAAPEAPAAPAPPPAASNRTSICPRSTDCPTAHNTSATRPSPGA
ncbi:MAG: hypothetical protein FD129_1741, partial [bacterium]